MSENPQLPSPSVSQSVKRDYLQSLAAINIQLESSSSSAKVSAVYNHTMTYCWSRHNISDLDLPFKLILI